eukprot:c13119_g1_i1.p1 GENE.c13119_g1_i1~~c13119_g1_i1.p1  ORF type:complete len:211 (-),score=21.02 c13119_g1_i1:427-1059(-)
MGAGDAPEQMTTPSALVLVLSVVLLCSSSVVGQESSSTTLSISFTSSDSDTPTPSPSPLSPTPSPSIIITPIVHHRLSIALKLLIWLSALCFLGLASCLICYLCFPSSRIARIKPLRILSYRRRLQATALSDAAQDQEINERPKQRLLSSHQPQMDDIVFDDGVGHDEFEVDLRIPDERPHRSLLSQIPSSVPETEFLGNRGTNSGWFVL